MIVRESLKSLRPLRKPTSIIEHHDDRGLWYVTMIAGEGLY